MDHWGASLYGDPCRGCGFAWSMSDERALEAIATVSKRLAGLPPAVTGSERRPDLSWSVGEYVCHTGDNLRIWSERVGGTLEGAGSAIGSYDQDLLAQARNYREIHFATARRSLRRAAEEYASTLEQAPASGVLLVHPERGELTRSDVVHANAHDVLHHAWDVEQILGSLLSVPESPTSA